MNILCVDCIGYKAGDSVKNDMCSNYAEFEMVRGELNIKDYCLTERSSTGRCRPQGLNFKAMKPVVVEKVKSLTNRKK